MLFVFDETECAMQYEFESAKRLRARPRGVITPALKRSLRIFARISLLIVLPVVIVAGAILIAYWQSS
jgi:hypothetical protein